MKGDVVEFENRFLSCAQEVCPQVEGDLILGCSRKMSMSILRFHVVNGGKQPRNMRILGEAGNLAIASK